MAVANKIVADFDFISDLDDNEDVKTTWKLRGLTGIEWLDCVSTGRVDYAKVIRYGLIDWSNYVDSEGNQIEFNQVHFDQIPSGYLTDIYLQLDKATRTGVEERKNS